MLAVALTVLALLGVVAAAGTATAQSDQPTVVVTDGTTAPDGTTTVAVVLTDAPNGLSGYYLELAVGNGEVARIESASYPDRFGLTTGPEITADGTAVTLEAADVDDAVGPSSTNVTLATVTIAGAASGDVTLSVEPRQFDDDGGGSFSPATQSGTLTVTGSEEGGTVSSGQSSGGTNGDAESESVMPESGSDGGAESTPVSTPLPALLSLVAIAVLAGILLSRRT
ncbi:MAG: hypothetical protein ABEI27_13515 [Halobellus sp.]|uniref:hypothetical protein n=1 Tax=Halobellus sp. TaxID=1979212 RepID=UPI0035D4D2A4